MNNLQIGNPDEQAIEVACRAFAGLQRGAATGHWDGFLDLLSDDVRLQVPNTSGFEGLITGRKRARELWKEHHGKFHGGSRLEGKRVAVNGTLVMIESRVEGILGGLSVANGLVFVFEINRNEVASMYEYVIYTGNPASTPWNNQEFGRDLFAEVDSAIPYNEDVSR